MDFIRRKIKWESCGQFGSPVESLSTEFHGNIGERAETAPVKGLLTVPVVPDSPIPDVPRW